MNWGTKIVIGMAIAMSAVVFAGVYMVSHDTDTLEENDYYEKGLSYEVAYKKKENVTRDRTKVDISIVRDSLYITFAQHANEGTLYLKRPSDRTLDQKIQFTTANLNYHKVPIHKLPKGVWHIQLEWEHVGIPYLQEQDIYIK